jgi:uncharacterized protein YndB with AHSA1/START domain
MPYSTSTSITVRAPRARVWDAITNPAVVKQYFFGTDLVTDWKVGAPLYFRGEWQGKRYEDRGTVLLFEPMKALAFNYWSSMSGSEDRLEQRQIVRYELEETADGVRVTVGQSNVASQAIADHSAQNWRGVLEALKRLLEGAPAASPPQPR